MDTMKNSIITFFLSIPLFLYAESNALNFIPPAPKLDVKSFVLMDYNSGQILAESNCHQEFQPASLTKMMTMYTIDHDLKMGRVKLTDEVFISRKSRQTPGSRMYLEEKTQVPLKQIIKGIIIQSGNDASVAAAEHCAGDEKTFAQLMNFYAKKLGMNNTNFANATGLPNKEHYSSAYDLALLSRALIKEFPNSYSVYSEKSFSYNNIEQNNRNRLLWENTFVDGIKTGMTDGAGYCLASSAKKGDMRLIAVVLGAENEKLRSYESLRLLQYGFRFFQSHPILKKDEALTKERIWMGETKFVEVGALDDLFVAIPAGSLDNLEVKLEVQKHIVAPLHKGQEIGTIKIMIGDQVYKEVSAVSLENVNKASTLTSIQDNVKLTVTKFMDKLG